MKDGLSAKESSPSKESSTAKESSPVKQGIGAAKEVASSATHAYAEAKDQLGAAASSVASRVEDAAGQVKERGQQLVHAAADQATELYQSASELAHDAADGAREGVRTASRYARRAGGASVSFAGTHALPLSLIGLGLGWLAMSIRADRARRVETDLRMSHDAYRPTQARRSPSLRGEYREPIADLREPIVSDGTSESPKLLGVRTIDVGRGY